MSFDYYSSPSTCAQCGELISGGRYGKDCVTTQHETIFYHKKCHEEYLESLKFCVTCKEKHPSLGFMRGRQCAECSLKEKKCFECGWFGQHSFFTKDEELELHTKIPFTKDGTGYFHPSCLVRYCKDFYKCVRCFQRLTSETSVRDDTHFPLCKTCCFEERKCKCCLNEASSIFTIKGERMYLHLDKCLQKYCRQTRHCSVCFGNLRKGREKSVCTRCCQSLKICSECEVRIKRGEWFYIIDTDGRGDEIYTHQKDCYPALLKNHYAFFCMFEGCMECALRGRSVFCHYHATQQPTSLIKLYIK